jgi:hypothetical protein
MPTASAAITSATPTLTQAQAMIRLPLPHPVIRRYPRLVPHRRTHIEQTAGPRESLVHHLMFAETGVPVLLGLFCEVNA